LTVDNWQLIIVDMLQWAHSSLKKKLTVAKLAMKFLKAAIVIFCSTISVLPQSDMEYALSRQKGNKIVLLGEWSADNLAKWKTLIGSQEIYGHGFALLDCGAIVIERNISTLDGWLRQRYGINTAARWLALDNENKLMLSGVQIPTPKEFDQSLDAKGIKTPLRKLRDFLKENPGHLDAMADLLKEVRRRAIHLMPDSTTEDFNDETDLKTWGVMAAETDKVFSGAWLGADINFFRLGEASPERHSKLMKATFRKHISKVEEAIRLHPANMTLWNIWAWMASGIGDYRWEKFIGGFEPIVFSKSSGLETGVNSTPSVEVCAWLVEEASNRKEWGVVAKFAKVASLDIDYKKESKLEWLPGDRGVGITSYFPKTPGHPVKTVYARQIEALLRLGDIDAANNAYDRMIRTQGIETLLRLSDTDIANSTPYVKEQRMECAESVAAIANVARSMGMESLAQTWAHGQQVNPKPSVDIRYFPQNNGNPQILASDVDSDAFEAFHRYCDIMNNHLSIAGLPHLKNTIEWKRGEPRWVLISDDLRILHQDSSIPNFDEFKAILDRFEIKSTTELYRKYLQDNGYSPGIALSLACDIISYIKYDEQNADPYDNSRNEVLALEASRYLNGVLQDSPDALVYMPIPYGDRKSISALMKPLAKPLLSNLEPLIEKKPSAQNLWIAWLFWSIIEGQGRSLESILERAKPSPLSDDGLLGLPRYVIDAYLEECKKNGNWHKVAALIKTAWDREYNRLKDNPKSWTNNLKKDDLGDVLGVPLMEAYLQDGNLVDADEIFKAVLDIGGRFKNFSKIIKLAKAKGNDSLAARWQAALAR